MSTQWSGDAAGLLLATALGFLLFALALVAGGVGHALGLLLVVVSAGRRLLTPAGLGPLVLLGLVGAAGGGVSAVILLFLAPALLELGLAEELLLLVGAFADALLARSCLGHDGPLDETRRGQSGQRRLQLYALGGRGGGSGGVEDRGGGVGGVGEKAVRLLVQGEGVVEQLRGGENALHGQTLHEQGGVVTQAAADLLDIGGVAGAAAERGFMDAVEDADIAGLVRGRGGRGAGVGGGAGGGEGGGGG